jgi:hypothetical protein
VEPEILKMKYCYKIGLTFITLLILACEKELDLNLPVTPSKLVVEGWIENGMRAEIILSHSMPYFSSIDSTTFDEFRATTAKITMVCDQEEEILTLRSNQSYFPPYIYRSDRTGETGRTYSIEVILNRDTVTATTTIPEPVPLDSVWFEKDAGMETKGRLWVRLSDNPNQQNFYRLLYKRKNKDDRFLATNFSTFNDKMINGKTVEMGFLRGISSMIALEEEYYFETGDTISVKFCTIDSEQFDFWNVFQGNVISSANPLATSNNQLKSNVKGGLGIWTGYGAMYYGVVAGE